MKPIHAEESTGQMSVEEDLESRNKALLEAGYELWESPTQVSDLGITMPEGFAQPHPYKNLMRGYKPRHRGNDIGAVGDTLHGLGSVVNAVHKSEITFIGKPEVDAKNFGRPDKRKGHVKRGGYTYPRRIEAPGYGAVYPFTRTYGRWRSGTVIVTRIIGGPLHDHIFRYMHLAAIRPDLKVGDIVLAGEHIGLMGGTAVQDSGPHVHIDLETPEKKRLDPAPFVGLPPSSYCSEETLALAKSAIRAEPESLISQPKAKKEPVTYTPTTHRVPTTLRDSYRSKKKNTLIPEFRTLKRK